MISGRSPINRFQRWTQQNFIFISKIGRYPEWDVMRKRAYGRIGKITKNRYTRLAVMRIYLYKYRRNQPVYMHTTAFPFSTWHKFQNINLDILCGIEGCVLLYSGVPTMYMPPNTATLSIRNWWRFYDYILLLSWVILLKSFLEKLLSKYSFFFHVVYSLEE